MSVTIEACMEQRRRHERYREREQTITSLDHQIVAAVSDVFQVSVTEILPPFTVSRGSNAIHARVVLIGVLAHWRCLTDATISRFLQCRNQHLVTGRMRTWLHKPKAERLCWITGISAVVGDRIKNGRQTNHPTEGTPCNS